MDRDEMYAVCQDNALADLLWPYVEVAQAAKTLLTADAINDEWTLERNNFPQEAINALRVLKSREL